jgi:hypothetical protein
MEYYKFTEIIDYGSESSYFYFKVPQGQELYFHYLKNLLDNDNFDIYSINDEMFIEENIKIEENVGYINFFKIKSIIVDRLQKEVDINSILFDLFDNGNLVNFSLSNNKWKYIKFSN